jgi:hypothetical protein
MFAIIRLHASEEWPETSQRKSQGSHTIRKGKTGENRRRKVMGLKPKNGTEGELASPWQYMPASSTGFQPKAEWSARLGSLYR